VVGRGKVTWESSGKGQMGGSFDWDRRGQPSGFKKKKKEVFGWGDGGREQFILEGFD